MNGHWRIKSDTVRDALRAQGYEQRDLAEYLGRDNGYVGKWLNNRITMPWTALIATADFLAMPVEMLVERIGHNGASIRYSASSTRSLPVVGKVGAGSQFNPPLFLDGDTPAGVGLLGYVDFPTNDPHSFVLRVEGDSMMPRYPEGTDVVIVPSLGFAQGHVHLVKDTAGNAWLKVVRFNGQFFTLKSFNIEQEDIVRSVEEIEDHPTYGKIIWRATWFQAPPVHGVAR